MNQSQQRHERRTEEKITLAEAADRSSPAQADAFQRIEAALEKADDSYSAEVVYEYTCKDTSVVHISSSDCFWKPGELGADRCHIVIGPHGGLKKAQQRSEITHSERDHVKEATGGQRYAWNRLLNAVERAA